MESRETDLPVSADVLEDNIVSRLSHRDIVRFSLTTTSHYNLFSSCIFWEKLIISQFNIAHETLTKFPNLNRSKLYKYLEAAWRNKGLPIEIKSFCFFPDNHEKLLTCLYGQVKSLPTNEYRLWMWVAMAGNYHPTLHLLLYQVEFAEDEQLAMSLQLGYVPKVELRNNIKPPDSQELGKQLLQAVKYDHLTLLKYLFAYAKKTSTGINNLERVFYESVYYSSFDCAKWLMENQNCEPGSAEISRAMENGDEEMLVLLLPKFTIDPAQKTAFLINLWSRARFDVIKSGNTNLLAFVFHGGVVNETEAEEYLDKAIKSGNPQMFAAIKKIFPNFDVTDALPEWMLHSFTGGHLQMAQYLLDTYKPDYFLSLTPGAVRVLLHCVFRKGNCGVIVYLLDNIAKQTPGGEELISTFMQVQKNQEEDQLAAYLYNLIKDFFKDRYVSSLLLNQKDDFFPKWRVV